MEATDRDPVVREYSTRRVSTFQQTWRLETVMDTCIQSSMHLTCNMIKINRAVSYYQHACPGKAATTSSSSQPAKDIKGQQRLLIYRNELIDLRQELRA
eukprot:759378-Hanusia_phi.AAC.1